MGTPFDEREPAGQGEESGRAPDASSSSNADIVAELKLLRREIALLRTELLARERPVVAAEPAVPAPRRAIPLPATLRRLPARARTTATDARARLVGWRAGPEWTPPHALLWDIAALLVIGVAAWLLRYVDLSTIPHGLHGDEAATGLEARRVLDEGWIGVYTGSAGGNPTGAYYLAAIPLSLIGDPVVAVRILSVLFGVAGVLALYGLVRRNLGFGSAVVAASVLAFSEWHIQFSRTGFVTGLWPTVVIAGVIALMEAIRSGSWRWWAAAGALLSAGVYVYNGHAPFLLVVALFVGWRLFGWTTVAAAACLAAATLGPWPVALGLAAVVVVLLALTPQLRERARLVNAAAFTGASLLVLRGMIRFARAHRQDYFGRSEQLSVFRTDEWHARTGLLDQSAFLADRYRDFWDRLTFAPRPDGVDLGGVTPLVPELTLYLCLAGLVIALVRRPSPLVALAALVVAATPLTAVLTDLTLRRALVILPFLALLAGVGATEVARLAFRRGRGAGVVAGLVLVGLLGLSGYQNATDFFGATVDSGPARQTFAVELRETADYLKTLPPDAYVYFYCDRWILRYDVVQLIAPDVVGEDRSPVWGGTGTLAVDPTKGAPVFVLMGAHTAELPRLQAMYPGGEVVVGTTLPLPLDGPAYVAYIPPPGSRYNRTYVPILSRSLRVPRGTPRPVAPSSPRRTHVPPVAYRHHGPPIVSTTPPLVPMTRPLVPLRPGDDAPVDLGVDRPVQGTSPPTRDHRWWDPALAWIEARGLAAAAAACWLLVILAATFDRATSTPQAVVVGLYALAYVAGGTLAARTAVGDLLRGRVNVDLLMITAAAGAAVVNAWGEGAVLLALFSSSGALEHYALDRTRRAVRSLMELSSEVAVVVRDGLETVVPVGQVLVGELVRIRPAERIPVDGEVVEGASEVDQASITGESAPVAKRGGDAVFAGTLNGTGTLLVRVTRQAGESTLARIVRVVEEAREQKSRTQRFAEAFEGRYAVGVIAISALVFLVPWLGLGRDVGDSFYRAMTLLVVLSPCALVISTPASTLAALANAARHGILFKGGGYLEQAGTIRTVAFDKTGTLTMGTPVVTDVIPLAGWNEAELLARAAAVESRSEHHLADAIVQEAHRRGLPLGEPEEFRSVPGKGVVAMLAGERIAIGDDHLMQDLAVDAGRGAEIVDGLGEAGKTAVLVAEGCTLRGVIALADQVRPSARAIVDRLRTAGVDRFAMLTGDNDRVARAVAAEVGIADVWAGLLPEQKLDIIRALRASGPVAMVGDGVNDAPALAVADLGIAMGGAATDVALETADVVLMADDLALLPYAIRLSRRTRRTIVQNLTFALGVITVLALAALIVGIPLPLGVVGHEGSTALVVLNGLRLLRDDGGKA